MGFFINPGALPGGPEWKEACAALSEGEAEGVELLRDALACGASSLSGLFQVTGLMIVYGLILYNASSLIAGGSELLLLVPSLRGIVGSVVLPVLGAVPDGCIVFFSGLGPNAQEEISVGVGALAGSTCMLLTVPWFLAILAGRVDLRNVDGHVVATYTKRPKLTPGNFGALTAGVKPEPVVRRTGSIMAITALGYVIIQGSAFLSGSVFAGDHTEKATSLAAAKEKMPAAFCFVVSIAFFVAYMVYQITSTNPDEAEVRDNIVDNVAETHIRRHEVSLIATRSDALFETALDEEAHLLDSTKAVHLRNLLAIFFKDYDRNDDKTMCANELASLLKDIGESMTKEGLDDLITRLDTNGDGFITKEEFVANMPGFLRERALARKTKPASDPLAVAEEAARALVEEGDEDEEEHEVPHDLRDLPLDEQIRRVLQRSATMMIAGTALVLIFSDPMVEVMSDMGYRLGIPPFYISFVLAPLASNASELLAAYQYALKKTRKTVTISFSTLLGAAILNNTFVLAIFMALIYLQGLAWQFTAETISILCVEAIMLYFSRKEVLTLRDGFLVLSVFPLSLFIVAFLENVVGLD